MEFMTTKEAVKKWNISERRIRQLLQEERWNSSMPLKTETVGIFQLMQ